MYIINYTTNEGKIKRTFIFLETYTCKPNTVNRLYKRVGVNVIDNNIKLVNENQSRTIRRCNRKRTNNRKFQLVGIRKYDSFIKE